MDNDELLWIIGKGLRQSIKRIKDNGQQVELWQVLNGQLGSLRDTEIKRRREQATKKPRVTGEDSE